MHFHDKRDFVPLVNQSRGPLHKTFTREKTRVKYENSGKHNSIIDFTIGKKLSFSQVKVLCNRPQMCCSDKKTSSMDRTTNGIIRN